MYIINKRFNWGNYVDPALPQDLWEDNTPGIKHGGLRHIIFTGTLNRRVKCHGDPHIKYQRILSNRKLSQANIYNYLN
jgi:hypothetical protein